MFDTIHLKYNLELTRVELLDSWIEHKLYKDQRCINVFYSRKHYVNGAEIRMTYRPSCYSNSPLLYIQISSLSKLLFGNNILQIKDIEEAITGANEIIHTLLPRSTIDIGVGILERIDFVHDYFVGSHTVDYLAAISIMIYPHRTRCVYLNNSRKNEQNNGVWFRCKDAICKFYDKGLESGNRLADGYLRHECELRDTDEIAIATGLQLPTLRGINNQVVYNVLKRDLVRLGLWQTSIIGNEYSLEMLRKVYGDRQAKHLANILRDTQDHPGISKAELAKLNGIKIPATNKAFRQINAAGIAIGMINGKNMLLPLDLPVNDQWGSEIVTKGASDTEIYLMIDVQNLSRS